MFDCKRFSYKRISSEQPKKEEKKIQISKQNVREERKRRSKKRLNFEGNKNKFEIDDTIILKTTTLFHFETNAFAKGRTTVNLAGEDTLHTQNAITRSIH